MIHLNYETDRVLSLVGIHCAIFNVHILYNSESRMNSYTGFGHVKLVLIGSSRFLGDKCGGLNLFYRINNVT